MKSYSSKRSEGKILFKNLTKNKTIERNIETFRNISLNLDLGDIYTIEYHDYNQDIHGKINNILPSDYNGEDVFLILNNHQEKLRQD